MEYTVQGTPDFDQQYRQLRQSAQNGNGASQALLKKLDKAIAKLKYNFRSGEHIPRNRIPEYYKVRYGVENLWKINIDPNYRLVYTIRGTEIEVMSVLLEFPDHKAYNKRFKYQS